ncbi:protein MAIN-LIKE 2-like [Vicia villosa]|uniref:protein MAIN-LIKE 2-like n=1 Tax=Vicia villosa TaxID=3911 RepID=UPI00273C27A3|nr:protein MAIN-LIKE 2-like [Vicia villosa]
MSLLTMGQEHRGTISNIAEYDFTRFRTRAKPMDAPDPWIMSYIDRAGFGYVMNLVHTTIDTKFILALCERWRPETHTFHLPTGECTVTLEDVYMLLGLSTNEKEVFVNVQQLNALCVEMLGVDLIEGEGRERGRGQGTGNSVNFMYLSLLEDIDEIKMYSWGFAVLDYLYNSLCKNAKNDSCTFYGCAFLLQAWGWWRMPVLAPENPHIYVFPYASRFNATGLDYTKTPVNKIIFYRKLLDRLRPQDFIWRPYLELGHESDPAEAAVWTAKSPIIRFTIMEMHQSDRVNLQFGMHQNISDPPECLEPWHLQKVSQ